MASRGPSSAAPVPLDDTPNLGIPRDALLLAASMVMFVSATNILTPLIPVVRDDLAVSITTAGLIVGAYGFARLAIDLPAGLLVDVVGPRRLAAIAVALMVGSSLLGFSASTVETLIAARIGSGLAIGILATIVLAGLGATASTANRGKVMSLFHVANNIGIATYPILGGLIGVWFDWRATFLVTAVLAAVAGTILLPVLLRVDLSKGRRSPASTDESRVLHGRRRVVAFTATNVGVVANMIHRHGFRNTVLPLYAAMALGLGGVSIASAIALMSIAGLMVATPGGMLGDRIGRRRIISAGLTALAVGDLTFLLTHDLVTFLLIAGLIGFGDFFASSQTALLSEIVPPTQRTRALSTYRFSSDLGSLIGPVLLAAVMDAAGAQTAILAAVGILFLAALAAWFGVPATVESRPDRTPVAPLSAPDVSPAQSEEVAAR
jgi:MFS family permease